MIWPIGAETNPRDLMDPITRQYEGRNTAVSLMQSLDFSDVSDTYWAKEPIVRFGALNIVQGDRRQYNPTGALTNEEALALMVRAAGREAEAKAMAEQMENNGQVQGGTAVVWSAGYMQIGANLNLITQDQLAEGLVPDPAELPETAFIRTNPVSREQIAEWAVRTLNILAPNNIAPIYSQQKIYEFSDWQDISLESLPYVEAATVNNIMNGTPQGTFNPQGNITRAEIVQVFKNMDELLYSAVGLQRNNGTVVSVQDKNTSNNGDTIDQTIIRIRKDDGTIEALLYESLEKPSGQVEVKDSVVYKNGDINGLRELEEGDTVEYITDLDGNTVYYVEVQGGEVITSMKGILQPISNIQQGTISLDDGTGEIYTYPMIENLYGTTFSEDGSETYDYVKIESDARKVSNLPINQWIEVTLRNQVIINIKYVGQPTAVSEIRGVVKENNPTWGYITIIDNDNQEITKKYYKNNISVEKQQYYDAEDEIGYIDEIFPDFRYDPRDTTIDSIEPGDVVYIRIDPQNPEYISDISAKTNYVMRYGSIRSLLGKGTLGTRVSIQYENGSTGIMEVPDSVPITKDGRLVSSSQLEPGDWIKVLVNQAIIDPGYVTETVKEIVVDARGYYITNVYRGQLSSIDLTQRVLRLKNSYELTKAGWGSLTQMRSLDLSREEVEFYNNGSRVPLDYIQRYLKSYDGDVYIAMEEYFDQERVRKVSFRSQRDEVLDADTVIDANGADEFKTVNYSESIYTDEGTIIARNGRLVDEQNIMPSDYVQVVLNGEGKAAVVQITPQPSFEGIQIYRGRIAGIEQANSFEVQSHAELLGMEWSYSPIPRTYTTDYDTVFYNEDGIADADSFIDYTEESQVDEVYTIFTKGSKALRVVENPYAREGIRGEIYGVDQSGIQLKDVSVYQRSSNRWREFSRKNVGAAIGLEPNTIMIKNDEIISIDELGIGDKIRVITTVDLREQYDDSDDNTVPGYIILVEG